MNRFRDCQSENSLATTSGLAQIIASFRAILADLALHPERIEEKSAAALRRAREQFTWDVKARQTMEVYRWVLDPARPRPTFPMPVKK